MAENKKSIIVYADWIELFESLSDTEAGLLIKHFFRYVNDLNPIAPDRITEISFIPIKQSLKRDLKKWEGILDGRSLNGRKGNLKRYNLDLYELFESGKYTLEEAENIAKTRKLSPPDSVAKKTLAKVADNVSVSVSVNDIIILNKSLLSEIKISDDRKGFLIKEKKIKASETQIGYFKIASSFQKLFIKNLKEKNSTTTQQENATFKNYIDPIRLMIEKKEATLDQIRQCYDYLNSSEGEFWKANILSTSKLREKISVILAKKNTIKKEVKKDFFVPDPNKREKI